MSEEVVHVQPSRDPAIIRALDEIVDALEIFGSADQKIANAKVAVKRYWRSGVSDPNVMTTLRALKSDPRVCAHNTFTTIMGVGPATAKRWVDAGLRSLADLRRAVGVGNVTLTHMQKVGLRWYRDLSTRIPRAEVTTIVRQMGEILAEICPGAVMEPAGSYRRGAVSSGDVDLIVTGAPARPNLSAVAVRIAADPRFVELVSSGPERLTFLWSDAGLPARQIDLLSVVRESFIPALNYFTGGFIHNTWLRGVAKSQGYRLNQAGLSKDGRTVQVDTEQDIYRILRAKYVEPAGRL